MRRAFVVVAFLTLPALMAAVGGVTASGGPVVADLVANQHDVVGKVSVSSDAVTLTVEFRLSGVGGWCLLETHLHIADSPDRIPQRNGNPVPGRFAYRTELDCVPSYTYAIPLSWRSGTKLAVAAHAVVEVPGGYGAIGSALPASASMHVTYPYPGAPSYVGAVVSGGGTLDGTHLGWCVDTSHVIFEYYTYSVKVHPTGGPLPADLVDHPEDLDLVNWLLAQRLVGETSTSGLGVYTYGDVQRAIWMLVEDELSEDGLGDYSQARTDEIASAAQANGEGFEPGCADVFGVLLQPVDAWGATIAQVILAETTFAQLGVPCQPTSGTAWGAGTVFPGKNWATYIEVTV